MNNGEKDKQKMIEELKSLHQSFVKEIDKLIAKINNYNKSKEVNRQDSEKREIKNILDKIYNKL